MYPVGTNLSRSTSRVHLWRRRGGRAAVRQLWEESLVPWHRGSIIRHRHSKRHRRAIRVCRPAAMSRHNRLRRTATYHTPGPRWYFTRSSCSSFFFLSLFLLFYFLLSRSTLQRYPATDTIDYELSKEKIKTPRHFKYLFMYKFQ